MCAEVTRSVRMQTPENILEFLCSLCLFYVLFQTCSPLCVFFYVRPCEGNCGVEFDNGTHSRPQFNAFRQCSPERFYARSCFSK